MAGPVAIYSDLRESSTFWLTACSAVESAGAQSFVNFCNHCSLRDWGRNCLDICSRGARTALCAGSWIRAHHAEKYYCLLLSGPSQIVKVLTKSSLYFCFNQTFALEIGHSNWQVKASCLHKILK